MIINHIIINCITVIIIIIIIIDKNTIMLISFVNCVGFHSRGIKTLIKLTVGLNKRSVIFFSLLREVGVA
jgi:hypothetical protein